MVRILIIIASTIFIGNLFAQNSGKGFNYQAVARGTDGVPKTQVNIELRFTFLLPDNAAPQWQETQMVTTDEFGLFTLTIGKGIRADGVVNTFKELNFGGKDLWLKVELREQGSWVEISRAQLLSVPYAEVAGNAQTMPVGSIVPFAGPRDKIPEGWLLCDGTQLSRSEYNMLYKVIGNGWGAGDGASTFHLPDLRGLFLRGIDYDRGHDDSRDAREAMYPGGNTNQNVGSLQRENFRNHNHGGFTKSVGDHIHTIFTTADAAGDAGGSTQSVGDGDSGPDPKHTFQTDPGGAHEHVINADGGKETRPDNAYVNYIIKY